MSNLIMTRMMVAFYIYEYLSVSTLSSWSSLQRDTEVSAPIPLPRGFKQPQQCSLSHSAQLQIASTWRTDPVNQPLAELLAVPDKQLDERQTNQTAARSMPSNDSEYKNRYDVLKALVIQYSREITDWDSLAALRDEASQMA